MRSGDSRGSARGRTSGQAGLRTFEQRLPGEGMGMGMRMGGLGQSSPLLWDHGCTGSRLGCCARCQPHTGVAGSADKGRAGPGTTVMLLGRGGEGRQPRAGRVPSRGSRTRHAAMIHPSHCSTALEILFAGCPSEKSLFPDNSKCNAHFAARQLCSNPNLLPRPQTPHHS